LVPLGLVAKLASRPERSVWSGHELVGNKFVMHIKVKRDSRGSRLQRGGVDLAYHGDQGVLIGSILKSIAVRIEEELEARPRRAPRELSVEHLVDLCEARVRRVSVALASADGERQEKRCASRRQ
jgi:hypothetical protein